jgi:hypothetical protein
LIDELFGFDAGDLDAGDVLPMSLGAAIVFPPMLLEDHDGSGAALPDDFPGHAGSGHRRLSDYDAAVSMDETDLVERHGTSHVTCHPFDLHHGPWFDSVLLPSGFNDRIHVLPSSVKDLSI